MVSCFNHVSLKSDQHEFSPNYIKTSSKEKVRKINKNDEQRRNALIFYQVLSTNYRHWCGEFVFGFWGLEGQTW